MPQRPSWAAMPRCTCSAAQFQCADSEGNEILVFLYDRWADRMAPLVAAGDLIHVAGTGVLVRPNTMCVPRTRDAMPCTATPCAMFARMLRTLSAPPPRRRSLPSDHPCRLVIAEPGLMAGLQPDTQGEIQSLSLPPALHAFQSEGSVPPIPESTPAAAAAAAAPSQGPSITLHVQTLVQAGTRYTCGTKSAFTAGQRVTTASLHECPNLPSLAGKASRRGELPSVIEGHAALAPPSAKRPRLDDHSPANDKPGLTSMEEWLTGLVKLSKRKKSRKGKRGRAHGKESEGGREPAAPALGWSGASPGTPPSLRQGQAGQSPHPCEMATQMPPPVHPCEAETQAWVDPCEGETQPPPLPNPCDCATQPPDMKRMAAEEDQPESDTSRDAGDASDRQAADDLAALSSQQQGAGHGPAGQALPFRYSLSQAAHDSSNTTNSTSGALQVSGGSTVAALEAMQPQDGASNVAGGAKELPSGVQLASQVASARVGYARSMSSAAVAQGGRAITPQNVSETGPWMSLALAHRARGGRTTKYSYTVLNKMKVGSIVNVYGVVLDTGLPFKSSGTDFKSRLLIVDEDRPSLAQACPVEVFLPNPSQHPIPREVGDVVRLHRVKANVFQSQEQLVLSGRNNRSAAVLFRRDGTYFSTSDSFSLSPAAAERVSELSAWGDALLKSKRLFTSPYLRSVADLTSPSQAFQGYVGTGVDMLGCVGAVFVNGEKLAGPWTREKKQALDAQCRRAGSGAACSVQLVLWDGTGSHGSSATSLPQGVSLQDIYPPCSGGVQLGSFVYVDASDQAGLEALNLQPGDWLRVRNAMACALKGGCFPRGAAIPEIDPGSTLLFVKAARSGFIKVPPFALDVQERLKFVQTAGLLHTKRPHPPCLAPHAEHLQQSVAAELQRSCGSCKKLAKCSSACCLATLKPPQLPSRRWWPVHTRRASTECLAGSLGTGLLAL